MKRMELRMKINSLKDNEIAEKTDDKTSKKKRKINSTVSVEVIDLLKQRGYTQSKIASCMGVTTSFVSLVTHRKRNLTIDHLERLAKATDLPIALMLVGAMKRKKKQPQYMRNFYKAAEKALKLTRKPIT